MKKKLIHFAGLLLAFSCLALAGCSGGGEESVPERVSFLSGKSLTNSSYVRWIGRTEYSQSDSCVYTYYAATGFTVTFSGTELYVSYTATRTQDQANRPYFVSMVDGQNPQDGTAFCLTSDTQIVKVAKDLPQGEHTVTVLKRSEPENSLTAVKEICTDGSFMKPSAAAGLKFQILGGSGITGHGCLGSPSEAWTTENSSPFSSFGYLAAQEFSAECQFVSASGMGIQWGYRGTAALTDAYEAVGLVAEYHENGTTKAVKVTPKKWAHSSWTPDAVIVNIGGNDWNSHISTLSGTARAQAETQFKDAVTALLNRIHALYPQAVVVWTVNSKTSGNGKLANEAIQLLSYKERIAVVEIDNSKNGADNHADVTTHQANAQTVISALHSFGLS